MDPNYETPKSSREILKLVDQLVKANNLERALVEVKKAREMDPKNLYAFAYEERIQELFAQRQRQEKLKINSLGDVDIPQKKDLKPFHVSDQILQEPSVSKVPALFEEFKKAGLRTDDAPAGKIKRASKEALETYKQALLLVWSDGQKTDEEGRELEDLRQSLLITTEEHDRLDRQAKLECYIFLLKHLLQSPASKSEIGTNLTELRKSFDISPSEHSLIEANMASEDAGKSKRKSIAVIDDDEQMLTLMKEILMQALYDVKAFSTSDAAYDFLSKERPDLILCDISLETSTMNGFLFYERIRELRHLQHVPFVFITGLNDMVLIRAGKEMGVDDFLIKPVRRENLLATIRGRIRRYEELRLLAGLQ